MIICGLGVRLYENHKNGDFRIFGSGECCSAAEGCTRIASETDETLCIGREVMAQPFYCLLSYLKTRYRWDFPII